MVTNWDLLFKIRIANPEDSFQKHEIIKLLIVMKLLNKYKSQKSWLRIYTEHPLDNGLRCDIYFENLKSKEVIAYEIQNKITKEWLESRKRMYENWNVPFMNSSDWIPVPIKDAPDDIKELNKWLEKFVF